MKLILFSSSVPLKPLPCRNTIPCRQMRRGALWPSTFLEVGSGATFSKFSPVWNPAAPQRRLPLKLLKGIHPSITWEEVMSLGIVEIHFLFPLNNFYGLYITLRPLLWGVMHRVSSFLWRDTVGGHISYRHMYIYINIYIHLCIYIYLYTLLFNIYTHMDIYIYAYSLAPSRYSHPGVDRIWDIFKNDFQK